MPRPLPERPAIVPHAPCKAHEQTPITEAEVIDALGKLDPVWDELFRAERERVVRLLVKEAVLSPDGLTIHIRTNGLRSAVAELRDGAGGTVADNAETLDVHVPMELRHRGGRKEIILPPDAHTAADVGPRRPIVVALARAYKWQQMLDMGEVPGIAAIAEHCGLGRTYVSRILGLAMLSPSLVAAVLNGTEPDGLSLAKLHQGIPVRWDRQAKGLS